MAAFEELGLMTELSAAIQELNWNLPTDIQSEAIPTILGGGDVLMAAETGTGKTGAFCLPIIQIVFESLKALAKENVQRNKAAPMCVILEPTNELAEQTYQQIEQFKKKLTSLEIKNVLVVGSIPISDQLRLISAGLDIITCTPGRVRDLVQNNKISLNQTKFFVLDEADSLVSNGDILRSIRELLNKIPKYTTKNERLQIIVCSATLHNNNVKRLADQCMHFPQWIDLKGQDSVPDTVHQVVCMIDPRDNMSWARLRSKEGESVQTDQVHARDDIRPGTDNQETLSEAVKVLKGAYVLKAIQEHKMNKAIIFCRTRLDCDNFEAFLTLKGYKCLCLHSNRNAVERAKNFQLFREGKIEFLICTDVAARGLDVRGVSYVINVTLPSLEEKENYVHRIGRVGRAERMGLAISLVSTVPEKVWYHQCKSRGLNCTNTDLTNRGGCTKWYNEKQCLSEIEEHLGITINQVNSDLTVPLNEFDGKVVYGEKRLDKNCKYMGHAVELSCKVKELNEMEKKTQLSFLSLFVNIK